MAAGRTTKCLVRIREPWVVPRVPMVAIATLSAPSSDGGSPSFWAALGWALVPRQSQVHGMFSQAGHPSA